MFNLEKSIQTWKRQLRSNPAFEDGDIAELESHLREVMERLKSEGLSEEEAFEKASEEIGEPEPIGDELYKSRASQKAGAMPPWKQKSWIPMMLPNYFRVAYRTMKKSPIYSLINICGLSVGLAACLMIALYVQHEKSYDTWMDDSERIYRVPMDISSEGNTRRFSVVAAPVAPALKENFPQVENTLRLWQRPTQLVHLPDDQMFYEDYIYYAEPSFFEFFTLQMREGNPVTALTRPNTVVLSESAAERFFGTQTPLGQTLSINDTEFEVTGVMENTPKNTHHNFNMLMSWATLGDWGELDNWHSTMFFTYVKLQPNIDAVTFEENISDLAYRYVADELDQFKQSYLYNLQPITNIHLYSDYSYEAKPPGNAASVYIFSIIAVLVLLIASLNFVNLSTARSAIRAKEVGMRKVVGADRLSLIGQFMGEALLLSFLSLLGALLIFAVTLPLYSRLVGIEFGMDIFLNPTVITGLLVVALTVGLGAGFYPALVLSSFNPLNMFHSKSSKTSHGSLLRKVLVVGQFTISVILIAGTITVFKQLNFMMDKELGFHTDHMLVLPVRGGFDLQKQYPLIKSEFGGLSSVEEVALSSSVPGRGVSNYGMRIVREQNDMTQSMYHLFVDYDFTETYGLEILAGRDFDPEYGQDLGQTFLINEEAVKSFGWSSPEEALGMVLQSGAGGFTAEIVGVFKNFHFRSVDQIVEPLVLNIRNNGLSTITLRLQTDNIANTINQVQSQWSTLFPDKTFDYFFLDEAFNAQYNNYERTGKILFTFSILAIVIACLGLYGLAAFSTQQRTKEIGIRKVLGATVSSLTVTISKDFVKLVLVAVILAVPVTWWLAGTWLNQFAYSIYLESSIFVIAGFIAILIAVITVCSQLIRIAIMNPVESLRSE